MGRQGSVSEGAPGESGGTSPEGRTPEVTAVVCNESEPPTATHKSGPGGRTTTVGRTLDEFHSGVRHHDLLTYLLT